MENQKGKTVKVVVLGDIGRSPRMQYHALSLATNGYKVNIIGYTNSTPIVDVLENEKIVITGLSPIIFNRGPKIVQYAVKTVWQTISLLLTLFITGKCDYLLCQNPPAIPTLPVCRFYCLFTKTKFIIDWHNYAYTIMALSTPPKFLLRFSKVMEQFFGQSSDNNLCVTHSMKVDLLEQWNIVARVLYDRPPHIFKPLTDEEKHKWFLKISQQYSEFKCPKTETSNYDYGSNDRTAFTQIHDNKVLFVENRPGILFSSTSWTSDEDFSILMDALQIYEITYDLAKNLPKLLCVITGKGPLKEFYMQKISSKNWQHVKVISPWLEASDYPMMVASADLGVCLHTSSSGLDLPMKVVDMFGANLPVCAYDFKCLHELVKHGFNGYTFKSSHELSEQIVKWFEGFPNNEQQNNIIKKIKYNLEEFQNQRWEANWNLKAKSFFES
ncbi:hypothetical protein ACJJTC_017595 [Scirpophaga incertulas]